MGQIIDGTSITLSNLIEASTGENIVLKRDRVFSKKERDNFKLIRERARTNGQYHKHLLRTVMKKKRTVLTLVPSKGKDDENNN